jgi:hypothetical protein
MVSELVSADAIDPRAIPVLSVMSGAFSLCVKGAAPEVRPPGVPAPDLPNFFGASRSDEDWLRSAGDDAMRPTVDDFLVLGATAIHTRQHFAEQYTVEQYFGPDLGPSENGVFQYLTLLPRVVVADRVLVTDDEEGPGALVQPEPVMAGSVDLNSVMFCPLIALRLGWQPDPNNAFTTLNERNEIVAKTLTWRDGGERRSDVDSEVHRHGYAVLVRKDQSEKIKPYLAKKYVACAWRAIQKGVNSDATVRSCSRILAGPV